MSDLATTHELEQLRNNLTDKLGELRRRATHAKEMLTPASYLANPWVRVGIGAVIGFALGSSGSGDSSGSSNSGMALALRHDSLWRTMLRAALATSVSVLVARALAPASEAVRDAR